MIVKKQRRTHNKANSLLGLQFLSDFGDQISAALLAASLLDITASAGKVGLVYFITTLGYVVFTLVGGYIGDRLCKRSIIVYSDLGRGLVVLVMIVAIREKSITLIYLTSFLLAILGSLNRPVKSSIWAAYIPENKLEKYNSLSEFSVQASSIVGPLIASFFILQERASLGFIIDAVTFFVCALAFTRIIARKTHLDVVVEKTRKREFLKGFSLLLSTREIFKYVFYDAIQMLGFGAFNAMFLVLAQRDFGWTKAQYSYHLSILAIFTSVGAFLGVTKYIAKMDHVTKLKVCALLSAICLGGVLHVKSFPAASLLFGICDGLTVFTIALTRTKVQVIAKSLFNEHLTSIIAARFIVIKAAALLGVGVCLIVDDFLGLQLTLAFFLVPIALSIVPFVTDPKIPNLGHTVSSMNRSKTLK